MLGGKMKEEKWVPVYGWHGLYEVSNLGRVRGVRRYAKRPNNGKMKIEPKIKSLHKCKKTGYLKASFWMLGEGRAYNVHKLVMESFVRDYDPKTEQIHHIDGNKENNFLDNLEFIDRKKHLALHNKDKKNWGKANKGTFRKGDGRVRNVTGKNQYSK